MVVALAHLIIRQETRMVMQVRTIHLMPQVPATQLPMAQMSTMPAHAATAEARITQTMAQTEVVVLQHLMDQRIPTAAQTIPQTGGTTVRNLVQTTEVRIQTHARATIHTARLHTAHRQTAAAVAQTTAVRVLPQVIHHQVQVMAAAVAAVAAEVAAVVVVAHAGHGKTTVREALI